MCYKVQVPLLFVALAIESEAPLVFYMCPLRSELCMAPTALLSEYGASSDGTHDARDTPLRKGIDPRFSTLQGARSSLSFVF